MSKKEQSDDTNFKENPTGETLFKVLHWHHSEQ